MRNASRAIIIEGGKMLVMQRNKYGSVYYTLVGGRVNEGETLEQGLVREVREETGLTVLTARPVFIEEHPAPYNRQYIYLCTVAPHDAVGIQDTSEEAFMNRLDANIHTLAWIETRLFGSLSFRTPQLQEAIVRALKNGFPAEPVTL